MEVTELAAVAGTLGGMLSVGAFVPQAYRILQRRSAADVSLLMYVAIIVGCLMWIFYAYVRGAMELLWTNVVIAAIALFIAVLRIHYGQRN